MGTMSELAASLRSNAKVLRSGKDRSMKKRQPLLSWLPTILLKPVVVGSGWLASMGFSLPALGVEPRPFGSAMLTSVGSLGVEMAFVPLNPFAHVPLIVAMGKLSLKPAVDEATGAVVARQVIPVGFTCFLRF